MTSRPILAVSLAGAIALLGGCEMQPPPPPPIPAAVIEVIPKPPVAATPIIWLPGHWDWNGTGYVWQAGRYVPRDGHGDLYMPGYWAQTASGWQWQPAHWM